MEDATNRCLAVSARRWRRALLAVAVATVVVFDVSGAAAEGGSAGGSIGGSIGGLVGGGEGGSSGGSIGGNIGGNIAPSRSRERRPTRERAARREPAPVTRHAQRAAPLGHRAQHAARYEPETRRGGGGNAFDGLWTVTTNACDASSGRLRISGGRLYAQGGGSSTSGSVAPGGALHAVGHTFSGLTQISSGRLSGSSGGGSFRRADGCTGSWTAYRG